MSRSSLAVTKLPQYDVPDGYTSWEYLQKLCRDGFQKRYPNDDGELAGAPEV